MKKSSVMAIAAALILSSCGTLTQLADSGRDQQFQDGIYSKTPDFMSKEDKKAGKAETEALIAKTKESPIYLFGDKKDTVMIPENYSATIRYDKSLNSTVVTVGENPYDWRNNLNPWSYYTPYSIGSSWYWSRHWSPFWSWSPWRYSWHDPWFYGWNDPWYYGGYWGRWYDPWDYWGYWGWYDPWYYGGYWGGYWYPHYAGWYGGFGPHWGHHHHGPGHGHGGHFDSNRWYGPRNETQVDGRVFTSAEKTTYRRGIGTSSSVSRGVTGSSSSRSSITASKASGGTSVARRTVTRQNTSVSGTQSSSKPVSTGNAPAYRRPSVSNRTSGESAYTRGSGSSSQSRGAVSNGASTTRNSSSYSRSSSDYNRSSSSSYNRSSSSSSTRSSGYSSGGGGGYSRGSSGGGGSYGGGGGSRSGGGGRR